MKCSKCKYLYFPYYESTYTSCRVFGDDLPDEYERKDGEGCVTAFVNWYKKER